MADRANWLRSSGAGPTARTWLARTRTLATPPGNVEKWYEVLLGNARGAAADGQWQTAYDIARQVDDAYPPGTDVSAKPYGERDDYTSLVWLAGQAALNKLGRPARRDADVRPLRPRQPVAADPVQGLLLGRPRRRGGRAAGGSGGLLRARGGLSRPVLRPARGRADRPAAEPRRRRSLSSQVAPELRAAFDARETVRAARFLGKIGQRQDQTAFVRQIAADAKTDTDHVLAAELARDLGRPDLGVMVGRSAMQNGLTRLFGRRLPDRAGARRA